MNTITTMPNVGSMLIAGRRVYQANKARREVARMSEWNRLHQTVIDVMARHDLGWLLEYMPLEMPSVWPHYQPPSRGEDWYLEAKLPDLVPIVTRWQYQIQTDADGFWAQALHSPPREEGYLFAVPMTSRPFLSTRTPEQEPDDWFFSNDIAEALAAAEESQRLNTMTFRLIPCEGDPLRQEVD